TATVTPGGPDFVQTGTNFSWDYGNLVPNTQETRSYIDPDNGGYQTSWITDCIFNGGGIFACPGKWNDLTNLALENDDNTSFLNLLPVGVSNIVTHYDKDNGLLREPMLGMSVGAGGLSLPIPLNYDIPDTIYRFPIDYLDVDSSEKAFSLDLTGFGADFIYDLKQKRVNTVEGWGEIITPYDTFPNTLKMRTVIYHQDSTTIGGNTLPANITTEVQYSWFDKGTGIPVLVAKGLLVAGVEVITSVDFLDSVRCFTPNAAFLTNPLLVIVDPISGNADVNFANLSQNADTYKWYFGDGDSSTQVNPAHTYSGGLYSVSLIACNSICDPLECDTTNFPLLVIDSSAVVANWTSSPNNPCVGDSISFNNFSFNGDTYFWDFGDGN
ncbi:MAG: PKD domain-containing protein, partial [Bacteroidetes bacterium]|nr:PKD domain-containing protein [Bacteroidota bacterium]